ncbi:hypothetical protein SAMN06265375_1051 [Muriicola jejuensis]|nr:hypothetical protein SAMN06265375_1051 [Muriicola jejuensis]
MSCATEKRVLYLHPLNEGSLGVKSKKDKFIDILVDSELSHRWRFRVSLYGLIKIL